MDKIYLLKNIDSKVRLYGTFLGSIEANLAKYYLYTDYRGLEWLHIHVKDDDKYFLIPFLRLGTGEEYIEYLKCL